MSTDVMFLFFIVNMWSVIASSSQQVCSEQHVYDRGYNMDTHTLRCPHNAPVKESNITWYYNGMEYDYEKGWGSNNYLHVADDHLRSDLANPTYITPSHEGNYTCQVLTPGGCYRYTITLIVYDAKPKNVFPTIDGFSDDVLTPLDRTVELFCSATVGIRNISTAWTNTLKWYFLANGSFIEPSNEDPAIAISYNDELQQEKSGIIRSRLVIPRVYPAHFGTYTCIAQNQLGEVAKNITVSQGVPASEKFEKYRTLCLCLIICCLLILLVIYIAWKRFKIPLKLYYSHRTQSDMTVTDINQDCKYKYDVVVFHGSSSSEWVFRELLPHLEDHYGYTCFLPHRDCPAGEILCEAVCIAMSTSRMVLMVVTQCLVNEPVDKWMMMQGISQALQEHTNTCAIIKEVMLGQGNFHDILRSVRKIYYPAAKASGTSHHKKKNSKINDRYYIDNSDVFGKMSSEVHLSSEYTSHCSGTSTLLECKTLCDVLYVGWSRNPDVIFWCEVLLNLPRPLPTSRQYLKYVAIEKAKK